MKYTADGMHPIMTNSADIDFANNIFVLDKHASDPTVADAIRLLRSRKPLHRHHVSLLLFGLAYENRRKHFKGSDFARMITAGTGFIDTAEWFWFGELPDQEIRERSTEAMNLMSSGLLRLPFAATIFHHSVDYVATGEATVAGYLGCNYMQVFYFCVDMTLMGPGRVHAVNEHIKSTDLRLEEDTFIIAEFRLEHYNGLGTVFSPRLALATRYEKDTDLETFGSYIVANPLKLSDHILPIESASTSGPVAIMNLVLNTKGMTMQRIEPDAKLNKARVKRKQPPLLPYTIVHTHKYVEAAKETARMAKGGTHASPRPHLRRGHVRRYDNGKRIWINDMIVNAGKGAYNPRDEYRVKT
jgi:hypothetical protein